MNDPEWRGNTLFHRARVLGWIVYDLTFKLWYARTAGTTANPAVRGEFDNRESAQDFLMFITTVENQ